jgi:hypothetical protein
MGAEELMNVAMSIHINRHESGWVAIACNDCRTILWQGEEDFLKMSKLSAVELLAFFLRHIHRGAS